jgi:hypothetical protein
MQSNRILNTLVAHILLAGVLYYILYSCGIFNFLPNENNLVRFDGSWYKSIRDSGYILIPNRGCNLAFFPAFPFLWRALAVSALDISVINLILFGASILFLLRNFQISNSLFFFIISTPSFIFFAVPYSESLFFLFSSMILVGYKKDLKTVKYIGFFGAATVRSVCLLFFPAIILCEVILSYKPGLTLKRKLINASCSILSCLAGLLISVSVQYLQTGKLFYFLTVQKYWRREWIIPRLPLTSMAPDRVLGTDAIAFTLGVIAVLLVLRLLYSSIKNHSLKRPCTVSPPIIFSMIYVIGITFMDTFFSLNSPGANIWSINRHIMSTPFSVVFIIWLCQEYSGGKKEIIVASLLVVVGIAFTGVFEYPKMIVQYCLFFLVVILFRYFPKYGDYFFVVYILMLLHQITFYNDFLMGQWLG